MQTRSGPSAFKIFLFCLANIVARSEEINAERGHSQTNKKLIIGCSRITNHVLQAARLTLYANLQSYLWLDVLNNMNVLNNSRLSIRLVNYMRHIYAGRSLINAGKTAKYEERLFELPHV